MTDRPSLPPGHESLRSATESQRAANDRLEAVLADTPSDRHRLAVVRELWALHRARGSIHMDETLNAFEREARARLDAGKAAPGGT